MADDTYTTKIQERDGGDTLAVASGGKIQVETGGSITPDSGTSPSVAALTDNSGGTSGGNVIASVTDAASAANGIATLAAKVNAMRAALAALGIVV